MEASRILFLSFTLIQVATSQYYSTTGNFPSYYSYYPSHFVPSSTSATNFQQRNLPQPPKSPKRSVATVPTVKCCPQTAQAYFLTTPTDITKASILNKDKEVKNSVPYNCPLCNNFADVKPNSKVVPPPPIGSTVFPGIIDKVPTVSIPKKLTNIDPNEIVSSKSFSDMYVKSKAVKNLRFDEELLEGFLTGLGIAS